MAGLFGSSRRSLIGWCLLLALIGFSGGDAGICSSHMHRQKGGGEGSGAGTSPGATRNFGHRLDHQCRMRLRGGAEKPDADAAAKHVDASKATNSCEEDTGSAPAPASPPPPAPAPAASHAKACGAHCQGNTSENLVPSPSRPGLMRYVSLLCRNTVHDAPPPAAGMPHSPAFSILRILVVCPGHSYAHSHAFDLTTAGSSAQ